MDIIEVLVYALEVVLGFVPKPSQSRFGCQSIGLK